ncbi:hypothetical protein [Actinophytocola sp.]|uniref:hypothetical protein n=1 Tax=Actinophytocola sp. TaxID=1872138 RepID=UPI003D6C1872
MDELNELLEQLGKRGYLWHGYRIDRHGPDVNGFVCRWDNCADVLVMTSADDGVHAYRTPTSATTDVFVPTHVLWWYGHNPVWTLRALLTLPPPDHQDAPSVLVPAPPGTGVPGERMPVRLRRRGH